jgi:hypothetical protein
VKRKAKPKPKPKTAAKRKKKSMNMGPLKHALDRVKGIVSGAMEQGEAFSPDDHVDDMRSATQELQSAVGEFKRALKRRMLDDGFIVPRKDKPYLRLLPGRPKGSKDPDDYDVVADFLKKRKKYLM